MFTPRTQILFCFLNILLALLSPMSHADGLTDLQNALKTLKQTAPFKAQVNATLINSKNDKNPPKQGHTQFRLEKNESSLAIHYPTELLATIDQEAELKRQNLQATTPTTDAVNRFKYSELSMLFNPMKDIQDDLRKATLVKEEAVTFQNSPARLLHLQIPLEKLSEQEKEHLKKYTADVKIWINEKGVPLASQSKGTGSGRFALVIGFEFHFEVKKTYILHGDRLLVTRLSSTSSNSGAGMNESETINADLDLLH